MKYRIKQKVRLKPLSECKEMFPGINPAMVDYFGREIVLSDVVQNAGEDGIDNMYESEETGSWYFHEDWIEFAVDDIDPIDQEIERLQNLKKAEIVQKEIDELQEKIDKKSNTFMNCLKWQNNQSEV